MKFSQAWLASVPKDFANSDSVFNNSGEEPTKLLTACVTTCVVANSEY